MERRAGLTSFSLKIAAIIAMTCNHVANVFAAQLPFPLMIALYSVGGITFPVMAFLLVVGYEHTSNVGRYAARLAIFAVIAQIPYSLLWGGTLNVLVTLLASLGVLYAMDRRQQGGKVASLLLAVIITAATVVCDWGCLGVLVVVLIRLWRDQPRGAVKALLVPMIFLALGGAVSLASGLSDSGVPFGTMTAGMVNSVGILGPAAEGAANLGYGLVGIGIAMVLVSAYNGQRGHPLKWFFYAYYPAHLLIIWLVKSAISMQLL